MNGITVIVFWQWNQKSSLQQQFHKICRLLVIDKSRTLDSPKTPYIRS